MIGCNTEQRTIAGSGKAGGPEQDWIVERRSWMGSSRLDSIMNAVKTLLVTQSIPYDDAKGRIIDDDANERAPQSIKTVIQYRSIVLHCYAYPISSRR